MNIICSIFTRFKHKLADNRNSQKQKSHLPKKKNPQKVTKITIKTQQTKTVKPYTQKHRKNA